MAAQADLASTVERQNAYVRQHNVSVLFENLATASIYARPDNVNSFLAEQVARMAEEGKEYTPTPSGQAVQTEEQAANYMKDHHVQLILEDLFSRLLVARPADPFKFLIEALGQSTYKTQYFTDDDLRGMHSLHDPTGNNYISVEQAKTALRNLGVQTAKVAKVPFSSARVTADEFVKVGRHLLDSAAQ